MQSGTPLLGTHPQPGPLGSQMDAVDPYSLYQASLSTLLHLPGQVEPPTPPQSGVDPPGTPAAAAAGPFTQPAVWALGTSTPFSNAASASSSSSGSNGSSSGSDDSSAGGAQAAHTSNGYISPAAALRAQLHIPAAFLQSSLRALGVAGTTLQVIITDDVRCRTLSSIPVSVPPPAAAGPIADAEGPDVAVQLELPTATWSAHLLPMASAAAPVGGEEVPPVGVWGINLVASSPPAPGSSRSRPTTTTTTAGATSRQPPAMRLLACMPMLALPAPVVDQLGDLWGHVVQQQGLSPAAACQEQLCLLQDLAAALMPTEVLARALQAAALEQPQQQPQLEVDEHGSIQAVVLGHADLAARAAAASSSSSGSSDSQVEYYIPRSWAGLEQPVVAAPTAVAAAPSGAAGLTSSGGTHTAPAVGFTHGSTPAVTPDHAQLAQEQDANGMPWETALVRASLHQAHLTSGLVQYFTQQQLPACAQLVEAAAQLRGGAGGTPGGMAGEGGAVGVPVAADLFQTSPTISLQAEAPAAPRAAQPPVGPPLAAFEVSASTTSTATSSSSGSAESDPGMGSGAAGEPSGISSAALQLLAPPGQPDPAGATHPHQGTQSQPQPQEHHHHHHHHHRQQQQQQQQRPTEVTGAQRIMRALVGASNTATPSPPSAGESLAGLRRRLQAARGSTAAAGQVGPAPDQGCSSSTRPAGADGATGSTSAGSGGGPEGAIAAGSSRLRNVLWALDVAFLLLFVPVVAHVTWLLLLPTAQQHHDQQQQASWSTLVNWLCLVLPLLLPWADSKGLWARGLVGVVERDKAIAWSQLLSTAACALPTVLRITPIDGVAQRLPRLTNSFFGVLLWSSVAKPWAPPVDKWPAVICSLCRLLDATSNVLALRRCVDQQAWQQLQASAVAPLGVLVPFVSLLPLLPAVVVHTLEPKLGMPA